MSVCRTLLILLIPLWIGGGGSSVARAADNVLLIVVDDLNSRISPLGDPDAITPNLDRLAARSVIFNNAICQNPFCAPSRASFLNGLYPWDIGKKTAGRVSISLAGMLPTRLRVHEHFAEQGYWTGSYGKVEHELDAERWHDSSPRRNSVFPAEKIIYTRSFNQYSNVSGRSEFFTIYDAPAEEFADGQHATNAIAALNARAIDGQPFFIAVGFEKPHRPWRVPKSITDLYDPSTFTLPENPPGTAQVWPSWSLPVGRSDERPLIDDDALREMLLAYYSSVTLMDSQLGRILDVMDLNQLWDDTVVMFVSDNGYNLMEHRRMFGKKLMTREAVHIPMLIAAPGGQQNQLCERQVGLIDVFPTLTDLAGIAPYCRRLEGFSLAPLLDDPEAPWPRVQFSTVVSTGSSSTRAKARIAQLGEWKLIESQNGGGLPWILNHRLDPHEFYPETAGPDAWEIGQETYEQLRQALTSELPSTSGIYYGTAPLFPPYDRDDDGLTGEQEIELKAFGFRPWADDSARLAKLGASLSHFGMRTGQTSIRATLTGLETGESYGNSVDACFPLVLMRSADWSQWDVLDTPLERLENNRFGADIELGPNEPTWYYRIGVR